MKVSHIATLAAVSSNSLVIGSPVAARADPIFVPGGGKFKLLGCFAEPGGSLRALPNVYANDSMTVELCLSTAADYAFAGVEYGRECWYGDTLDGGSTQVDTSNCEYLCPGDSSEYCGSGNHLILYSTGEAPPPPPKQPATVDGAAFYGCLTDSQTDRTLSENFLGSYEMTLDDCSSFCASYKYFGVEYASECYCGDSIGNSSTVADTSDCKIPCAGDSTETCGGANRLSVYARP